MINRFKFFLKSFAAIGMAVCLLVAVGYFYINTNVEKTVETKPQNIPYYNEIQNVGLLFCFNTNSTLIYFDFENETTSVIFAENESFNELYGYEVTYKIHCNYDLIGEMVDIFGGIDIEINGEALNCTGVQIADMFKRTVNADDLRRSVIKELLGAIAQKGITLEDMLHIIKNSETDLTVPQSYSFISGIGDAAKNVNFVN